MARTKAPLFSLDASGAVADSIVFSQWRGRPYVRRLVIPANPKSGLQVGMRSVLRFITQDYANLTTAEKNEWSDLADVDNITLLNAQVRDAQRRARRNLGWRKGPNEASGTTPSAPTVGVTAQPGALVISITPGANAPEYSWAVHMSTNTGFSVDISNLRRAVNESATSVTITGLPAGTQQFVVVRGVNNDGEFGSESTEQSGTPT